MENKNFYKSCNPEFRNRLFFESRLLMKNDPVPEEKEPAAEEKSAKSPRRKPREDKEEKVKDEARQAEAGLKGKIQRDKFKKDEGLPGKAAGKRGPEKEQKGPKKGPVTTGPRDPEKEQGEPRKGPDFKFPTTAPLDIKAFLEKDSAEENKKIDRWKINVTRENYQVNAQKWDHSTFAGLQKIYQDCQDLKIINQNPDFYNTMFVVLNSAVGNGNPYLAEDNGKYRPMFRSPTDIASRDAINALPKKGSFLGGEAFIKAFDHLQYLKANVLIAQDKAQLETLTAQRKLDEDPIGTKVTDFVRDNVATFQKAIRERDYATAGVYALGIYALWQTVGKKIFGDDHHAGGDAAHKGFDYKKWLLIGAAAYCGNKFLKNAGYDVLRMAGLKNIDAEVKGTPMENLQNILSQNEYAEQMKDLDYGLVLRMSDQRLTTLEDLYQQSNKNGIQFIHPREFPAIFPDLKNVWSFKMGIGEQGLKDYVGMSNTKLSPNEKEYISVGQQLYKLALAMRVTYDNTLHKDHDEYKGKTYEDALSNSTLKNSKVRHLMEATSDYTARDAGGLFSGKKLQEVAAKLREGTDKVLENNGFTLGSELGAGHFEGKLRGFPVVVVVDKDGYRVYLRNQYGKTYNKMPGRNFKLIPFEGAGMKRGADEVLDMVNKRMADLLKPLQGIRGRNQSVPKYVNGLWECDVTLPGSAEFKINAVSTKAIITPDAFGDGVTIQTENGVRIDLNEEISKQNPVEVALIPKIYSQKEFHALKVFANADLLRIRDDKPGDGGLVTLLIGKNRLKLDVKFDASTNKFSIVHTPPMLPPEQQLIQNPAFAQEYIEALDADEHFELNKNIRNLTELIKKSAPEGFVKHFFTSLSQQNATSAVSGFNLDTLSGSIPENFTDMVLKTSKTEVMERLRRAISKSSTLEEVEEARKTIIQDFNDRLVGIGKVIGEENVKLEKEGEKWDRDKFSARVIDRIRKASCISNAYAFAKSDFEFMVYKLPLPGFLTKRSDLSSSSHQAAGDLMGVFAYYTAHLDNHDFEGVKKDLDHLTYPATPTPVITDKTKDPALRGHLVIRYFEYVKNQIYNKANALGNLSNVPPATAVNVWQIKEFDKWVKDDGDYSSLDPMDSVPAYVHDETHPGGNHTKLDEAMAKEYQNVVDLLVMEYPDVFNENAINDYLRRKAVNQDGTPVSPEKIGILYRYQDSTGKTVCKLWDKTNRISKNSNGKRSNQIRQMQVETDQFINFIFTAKDPVTGDYRFFAQKPSLTARLIKRWPWLNNIL